MRGHLLKLAIVGAIVEQLGYIKKKELNTQEENIMALFILFLLVGLFWLVVLFRDLKEGFTNLFEWLLYTVVTYVILFLIICSTAIVLARYTYRDVEVDNVSIVGDSYIVERDNNTTSLKKDDYPVNIGDKNFLTYKKLVNPDNWFNNLFGFANEEELKNVSDEEFMKDAVVTRIGIDKDIIIEGGK